MWADVLMMTSDPISMMWTAAVRTALAPSNRVSGRIRRRRQGVDGGNSLACRLHTCMYARMLTQLAEVVWRPMPIDVHVQCERNARCIRGYKHGGRGGCCSFSISKASTVAKPVAADTTPTANRSTCMCTHACTRAHATNACHRGALRA